jgi:hypothetical protein
VNKPGNGAGFDIGENFDEREFNERIDRIWAKFEATRKGTQKESAAHQNGHKDDELSRRSISFRSSCLTRRRSGRAHGCTDGITSAAIVL